MKLYHIFTVECDILVFFSLCVCVCVCACACACVVHELGFCHVVMCFHWGFVGCVVIGDGSVLPEVVVVEVVAGVSKTAEVVICKITNNEDSSDPPAPVASWIRPKLALALGLSEMQKDDPRVLQIIERCEAQSADEKSVFMARLARDREFCG